MYEILRFNNISGVVEKYLPEGSFVFNDEAKDPHGILVRSGNMHGYEHGENLLAVARAGAGVNNIPTERYAKEGIVVFNTPGANANAVKELVIASMLLASRRIIEGIEWAKTLKGKGDAVAKLVEGGKASFAGPEIKGKRLGVVGLGAVGVMVANDARSLGMNVMGYDPYISVEHAWGLSRQIHRETSLEMLVAESDYISIHVPLGEKTKKMFDAQLLEYAKPGCVIMNFSRSELVCTQAMIDQLQSGRVGRYVTDFPVDELLDVEGVIAIPHLGASTPESEENCAAMAAEELNEYLLSGNIHNSVNFPDVVLPRTSSHRIAMIHANISNMVGQITALLATDKHNISDMINKSRGEMAYTIIDTDHDISAELLEKIQSVEGMVRVRCLGREHAAF